MDIFIEKPSYVHCMEFEARRESIIDLLMSLHVSLCFMNVSLTDKLVMFTYWIARRPHASLS